MTQAREKLISLADTPYYHCMARCVRRAFLFGEDSFTGRSYDHRKAWVVDKLAELSDVFSIDICAYAVMSNHYHVVLRVDVETAAGWSSKDVIDRWCSLFSGNLLVSRYRAGDAMSAAQKDKAVYEYIGHPYIIDFNFCLCYTPPMTQAREKLISLADTPYYHCMARCVRRAFLFGKDSFSGRRYDHRKVWVVDKLAELADVFSIDICAYAVMSNHYHVVLRVDVEAAAGWSSNDVIDRWCSLFSGNLLVSRYRAGDAMSAAQKDKAEEFVEEWRERLTNISWFMRVLNESIARRANEEDECKGRFWEGRFKSQALLDEAAVLACMAYVDLNPIRAGVAKTPEASEFTSIQQRISAFASRKVGSPSAGRPTVVRSKQSNTRSTKAKSSDRVRLPKLLPFNRGVVLRDGEKAIAFSRKDYLELIDWTGRAVDPRKRGAIPERAPPILKRLGFDAEHWLKYVPAVEREFTHAIGCRQRLVEYAQSLDCSWLRGQKVARALYA